MTDATPRLRHLTLAACLALVPRPATAQIMPTHASLRLALQAQPTALIGTWTNGPRAVHFKRVLLGAGAAPTDAFSPEAAHFAWPDDLLPASAAGGTVVAIFSGGNTTLVPVRSLKAARVGTPEELRRLLVRELLAEQAGEKDLRRREALIHQAGEIMTADEAQPLTKLLGDRDEWLRRIALASVIAATHESRYVQLGVKDLSDFLAGHDLSATIADAGETYGTKWRLLNFAYGFLKIYADHYAQDAAPFLPLYRAIAAKRDATVDVDGFGIKPLAYLGTVDDLALIYSYHGSKDEMTRREVREGIARILKLKLAGDEAQQDAAVAGALGKRGIR